MKEYHPSESAVATHMDEQVDPKANRQSFPPQKAAKPSRETRADREIEENMHLGR